MSSLQIKMQSPMGCRKCDSKREFEGWKLNRSNLEEQGRAMSVWDMGACCGKPQELEGNWDIWWIWNICNMVSSHYGTRREAPRERLKTFVRNRHMKDLVCSHGSWWHCRLHRESDTRSQKWCSHDQHTPTTPAWWPGPNNLDLDPRIYCRGSSTLCTWQGRTFWGLLGHVLFILTHHLLCAGGILLGRSTGHTCILPIGDWKVLPILFLIPTFLVMVSIAVKRHHVHRNSHKGKHLIWVA